jgi:hypothetical protein
MTRLVRWLLVLAVALTTLLAGPPSAAAATPLLDGFELRHLPPDLGGSTDFAYEYDDVAFVSRVWESGSDETGWRVDLSVAVLRGEPLSGARALHDWLVAYEERPAGEARYRPVRVLGAPGWWGRDEVFWSVRPGLAVVVRIDRSRWTAGQLLRTARGVRPAAALAQPLPSGPFAVATTRSISQ